MDRAAVPLIQTLDGFLVENRNHRLSVNWCCSDASTHAACIPANCKSAVTDHTSVESLPILVNLDIDVARSKTRLSSPWVSSLQFIYALICF